MVLFFMQFMILIKCYFSENLKNLYQNSILNNTLLEELSFLFHRIIYHLIKSRFTYIFKCNKTALFLYLKIISIGCRDPPLLLSKKKKGEYMKMENDYKKSDFWIKKSQNKEIYFIKINNQWIEVSKEVFHICKNSYQKIYRDNQRDYKKICHYQQIDLMNKYDNEQYEQDIIHCIYLKDIIKQLHIIMSQLPIDEKKIIKELYFKDKSIREVANELNMPKSTLHNKKNKILKKIKEKLGQ